ncbi:AraC family transcriptional regulator [Marinomonas sp.]|jgi:AraC-like DNA-binding protein|uniref:Transcriptional regulator, AraC family n=1 Tax=Marinomonas sp. (strain MWYL1) TaxID=400668 RepID=A6VRX5_MARMS
MAWLQAQDSFNPDALDNRVLGIAAELAQHDSGVHYHDKGQLLFCKQGSMRITLDNSLCLLPPARVAWIPPHVEHRVKVNDVVGYRSIYIDCNHYHGMPEEVTVLTASPLLREVLERIALAPFNTNWQDGAYANILAVCLDEITSAPLEVTLLPLPTDRRLRHLVAQEALPPLNRLSHLIGASEKTISRIFRRETGLSYQQWRQQWRLNKAIELLSIGWCQSEVASQLAFSSDSAFTTFFKNMVGCPPKIYMDRRK